MWTYEVLDESGLAAALKKLRKSHPHESAILMARLESVVDMLNCGLTLPQVRTRGWVHDKYKHGMLSLDAGGGKGQAKLRLYFLPDGDRLVVIVVGAGKKDSQAKDVRIAYEMVGAYLKDKPEQGETK